MCWYLVDKEYNIKEEINYTWISAEENHPEDNDLYWVIIKNKTYNTYESTICNYNNLLNVWEVLDDEQVLAWLPFYTFIPKIPSSIIKEESNGKDITP